MEPPMSNGSMHHREPKSEIDDTGQILQGASCTIACALHMPTETRVQVLSSRGACCIREEANFREVTDTKVHG
jgi:hypothetical protein